MIVQKKVSIQGDFAKVGEDIVDQGIIKILDEGKTISEDYGDRTAFSIQTLNGEKVLSFNQTSINNLIDGFGTDTKQWIGKDVKTWIVKQMIDKKLKNIVYLTPEGWIMSEDGEFMAPLE